MGVGDSTLRRWRCRQRLGVALRRRRGPRPGPVEAPVELQAQVAERVRKLSGLVGAESLRLAFPGLSRRRALVIKRDTLTAMERERKTRARRVQVALPGVVRGFDAMHIVRSPALTPAGWYSSVGQVAEVPVQVSSLSQRSAAGRHTATTDA